MPGVIDGRHWLRQRIAHLEEALGADSPPGQRGQIEVELAQAKAELHRTGRWRRWLFWGTPT